MKRIPAEKLRWKCDDALFDFDSAWFTADMFTGQHRACAALDYGLRNGFNMLVPMQGEAFVQSLMEYCKKGAKRKEPLDWVYVHGYKAVSFPSGAGRLFVNDMNALLDRLVSDFASEFNSVEYVTEEQSIQLQFEEMSAAKNASLEARIKDSGAELIRSGSILSVIGGDTEKLQKEVSAALDSIRMEEQVARTRLVELKEKRMRRLFLIWILPLRVKYPEVDDSYFDEMITSFVHTDLPSFVKEYKVSLFIEASETPVIYERNPTYNNLFGSIEHVFAPGGIPVTDVTMLKPGSLHKANGGVLVLNVYDLLTSAHSWSYLLKAVQTKEIKLHDVMASYRTTQLAVPDPEGIPLDVALVLVGPDTIFRLLFEKEPEFQALFPVTAVFDKNIERTDASCIDLSLLVSDFGRSKGIEFTSEGLASCLEYAVRCAETQKKINVFAVLQILPEIISYAEKGKVGKRQVKEALKSGELRNNRSEEVIKNRVVEGYTLIQTEGFVVGQINALGIVADADYQFGVVMRATANTYAGSGDVVNIEREVKTSGKTYDKGVFILSSYIKSRFGQKKALKMGASICMEQLSGSIDGDSASSTELYALLSSMSGVGINQGIAVTGSVNQKGEVQAIGGVTRKIEGFFDLCKARGLTGKQGVMIPESNEPDLMLKEEVVEAVRAGMFNIWSVANVDEGMKILTWIISEGVIDDAVASRFTEEEEE